jgi:tetratricopeptide (TPR) repeat protein
MPYSAKKLNNYIAPIQMNNKAAELLSLGRCQEARAILKKALRLTKLVTLELSSQSPRQTTCYHRSLQFCFTSCIPMDFGSELFVFQRAIMIIEPKEGLTLTFGQMHAKDLACAIIFNVSLSLHAESPTSSIFLDKALNGYRIALQMRKHKGHSNSLMMDLGLLNNIAYILVETSHYESARPYFRTIAHILQHHKSYDIDAKELEGFTNGALWRSPSCAGAA